MKFKEDDIKLYEIYSRLGDKEDEVLLQQEIIKQRVDLSRIAFKQYRDELVQTHSGYAIEEHKGEEDGFVGQMYLINRAGKPGDLDYSIGRVVDYNVPVKRCVEGPCAKIEITPISLITETMDKLYLINAKPADSEDSIFKTVMELVSQLNMISRKRLIREYNAAKTNQFKYNHTKDAIVPAIMLFENSLAYKEFKQLDPNSLVGRLIYKYHIHLFTLKKQNEENVYELLEE